MVDRVSGHTVRLNFLQEQSNVLKRGKPKITKSFF